MTEEHCSRDRGPSQADTVSTEDGPCFAGKSMEEEVEAGDSWERSHGGQNMRLSLNSCPQLLKETAWWCRRKHKNLPTIASVSRYATRCGIRVLRQIGPIDELRHRHELAYVDGNELDRMAFSGHTYDFGHRISYHGVYLACSLFDWVEGVVVDAAYDLGLPASTVVTVALMAGFAQSTIWVPERHRWVFQQEIAHFWRKYLKGRLDEITPNDY